MKTLLVKVSELKAEKYQLKLKDCRMKLRFKDETNLRKLIFIMLLSLFNINAFSFTAPELYTEEDQSQKGFFSLDKLGQRVINFGLVVKNKNYTIYRSSMLGKYGLKVLKKNLEKNNLPFPKTIIYMNKNGYSGFIPVVGSFAIEEYEAQREYGFRFFHGFDYQNRTYLDGYNPYEAKDDIDAEEELLGKKARQIFGPIDDNQVDGGIDNFVRILRIVLDKSNSPVLFHCFGGRHRTGMVTMAIRYLQGGNWVDGLRRETYILTLNKTLSLNPAQYEYYQYNKELVREENFEFIEQFSQDAKFLELRDIFAKELQVQNAGQQVQDLEFH